MVIANPTNSDEVENLLQHLLNIGVRWFGGAIPPEFGENQIYFHDQNPQMHLIPSVPGVYNLQGEVNMADQFFLYPFHEMVQYLFLVVNKELSTGRHEFKFETNEIHIRSAIIRLENLSQNSGISV